MPQLARLLNFRPSETFEAGIGEFKLEVRVKEEILQENEIPNIPLEDGTMVQDHIIVQPDQITIKGDVSKIHVRRTEINDVIENYSSIVDTAAVYLPSRTTFQVRQIRNKVASTAILIEGLASQLKRGRQILGFLPPNSDPQQGFFDMISHARKEKLEINVSMPFKTYENMIVKSFLLLADNIAVSAGFELTLQQIIKVEVTSVEKIRKIDSQTTETKIAGAVDKGVQTAVKTKDKASSFLYDAREAGSSLFSSGVDAVSDFIN